MEEPESPNAVNKSLKIHKVFKENDLVGFNCLRFIIVDPVYTLCLVISNYIACICVLIDFAAANSRMGQQKPSTLYTVSDPVLFELIYCMDIVFLVKTITEYVERRSVWKHGNKALILDIISLLPVEVLYVLVNGKNMMLFYVFRLRYLWRIVRHALDICQRKYRRVTPISIMITFLLVATILTIMFINLRFQILCNQKRGCFELSIELFFFEYFLMFSQVTSAGLYILNIPWLNRATQATIFFSILMFILVKFTCWRIICCTIKDLTYIHELAIACDLSSWQVKLGNLKRSKSLKWAHLDKMYLKHLKNCLNLYWQGINFINYNHVEVKGYIVGNLPPIIYTELKLDLSWNLFKHSILFKNEEKFVLRKIAEFTHYKIFMAGEPIYTRGIFKTYMVYIVSGSIRITSAENGESSLLSLAPGTCLGEISLFYQCPAVTTVICDTYCELVLIHCKDMLKLKEIYPKVYHDLKFKIWNRISEAKLYDFIRKCDIQSNFDPSMRYIKRVLRRGETSKFFFSNVKLEEESYLNETIFCAEYLSMYMINDDYHSGMAENVVQGGFFFKIHPNSSILRTWNFIIYCMIFSLCIIYPICAVPLSPEVHFIYSYYIDMVTLFFILDFLSVFFIAVQDKDGIHTSFDYICHVRIFNWDYFFNLMSAVPIELVASSLSPHLSPQVHKVLEANRLLKVRYLLKAFNRRQFFRTGELFLPSLLKSIFYFVIITLIGFYIVVFYEYLQYTEIKSLSSYYNAFLTLCFVVQYFFSSSIVSFDLASTTGPINFLPFLVLQYLAIIWKLGMITEMVASYSLVYARNIKYTDFIDDCKTVLSLYEYNAQDKKKIFDILHMHYSFKIGLYLSNTESTKKLIGKYLFTYQQSLLYQNYLLNEKLFEGIDDKTMKNIIEIGTVALIPKGQFIEYAGATAKEIYFIMNGDCGYLNKYSKLEKTLKAGDSLFIAEFVFKTKIMHNVIALTDCKLFALPNIDLRRKYTEHPNEYYLLKQIADEMNDKWPTVQEIDITTLTVPKEVHRSIHHFKDRYHTFIQGFGKVSLMSVIFLKYTITPNGKFWFYWEIFRLIFAYLAAFMGCFPFANYKDYYSPYFYIFRLLDLAALADIILRHYVVYYNELDIEVTHPWKTACNYWKTSLFVDFIAMIPLDLIFMNNPNPVIFFMVCPRFNRILQLYRVIGFKKYCTECRMEDMMLIIILLYILIIYLFYNFVFSTILFGHCEHNVITGLLICPKEVSSPWRTYFYYMYRYHKNIFNIGLTHDIYKHEETWKHCILCLIGFIYWMSFACLITSMHLFSNSLLTAYQIRMQRLVTFLNLRSPDKKVSKEIIKHFEYLWFLREGRDIEDAFSKFNKCCYEEMIYSQYAPNLQSSILFHGFPRAVLKEFLVNTQVSREFFLITGIIININDIGDKIHIIFKGEVDVYGPDLKFVVNLSVGSAFGCLDNVKYMRSTLLYVAKTHCEIIVVPSKVFYGISLQFPDFYENYMKLLRMTNCDYIKSFGNKSVVYSYGSRVLRTEAKHKYFWMTYICRKMFEVRKKPQSLDIIMSTIYFIGFFIECYEKCHKSRFIYLIITCYILDAIHLYKMYLNFIIAYEDDYGLLVTQRKLIALRYIKNYLIFLLDFFCAFPFELISLAFFKTGELWRIWSICRCNRLGRIVFLFKHINSMRNKLNVNVTFATLAKVVLYLLTLQQLTIIFISHDVGVIANCHDSVSCIYFKALRLQFSYMSAGTTIQHRLNTTRGYLKDIKYSLPYSFIMILTNITLLFVFAEGISSFQIMYYEQYKYESFVVVFKKKMEFRGVSLPLKNRISSYLENVYTQDRLVQFPSFLIIAPVYLREAVLNSMFGYHLRRHPVFKICHVDLIRQIASTFRTNYFFDGDFLVHKGDINKEMYFVHTGEVYGLSEDTLYQEVAERILKAGDYFGYEQLFGKDVGHAYSYKVAADAIILKLSAANVLPLLEFFPASKHTLFNFV